jgi:phage antirepressor YoqD-like protein
MTHRFVALFALGCALLVPMPAAAQIDDTSWGVTGGFSPQWAVPGDWLAGLFDAKTIDVKGPEFRLGIVRGTTMGGEWGVSLIHKRLSKQSTVAVSGNNDLLTVVANDAEMLGVEAHRFIPFTRINKVQVGVNLGAGIAQLRGFVTGSYVGTTSTDFTLPFPDALAVTGREIDWIPVGRAELAAATLVGERLKVRVSGGFNMPGFQVVSLSFSYLLGQDK